jgi:hypothetical protein
MSRKHKPKEIIGKLREAEIVLAKGGTVADACRRIGFTEQSSTHSVDLCPSAEALPERARLRRRKVLGDAD